MTAEPRRVRLVTVMVLLVTFLAGAATGAGLLFAFRPRFPHGRPPVPALRGIELTAEQRANVDRIFETYRPRIEAVVRETFPRVRAIEEEMNGAVRAELTPEQQRRFDDNEAHRPPFPPPPGLPPPPGFPPP